MAIRTHVVWRCTQTVDSKYETDYCELVSHVSWSHIQSVTFNLSWAHFHRHLTTPALSTPTLSTPVTWCHIVHSCNVCPCHIVLICPLLQIPSLQHGAELSTPALSTPANSAFPTLHRIWSVTCVADKYVADYTAKFCPTLQQKDYRFTHTVN